MSENLKYEDCFIVFLDILGVKELVSNLDNKPELLKKIIDTLKINQVFAESNQKKTTQGALDIRSWYFSDSFVFLMKTKNKNLPHLFLIIRYLQDRLWEKGYCLRGAVTREKMYYPNNDENILLGQGIINTYKLESELAIYPRIVVDNNLVKYIDDELIAYPFGKSGNLIDFIKKDYDGVYFLDLLNKNILRKKNEKVVKEKNSKFFISCNPNAKSNYDNIIGKVNSIVHANLTKEYINKIKIKQKYEWLKSYLEQIQRDG